MSESNEIIILITSTSAAILLLLLIITIILLNLQKKRMINDKMIEYYKTNFQKNLLKSQIEIQEETLSIISQEVHDNIGLSLTLAKLNLATLNNLKDKKISYISKQSDELITTALNDMRSLSHIMNPEVVKSVGLLTSLKEEQKRINKTKILNVNLEATGEPFYLDGHKELVIFRIVQELLGNIIKHSFATTAWIILLYQDEWIYLTVKDNGIGIQNDKTNKRTSAGIINIESRCKILNSTLQINTGSSGTTTTITIPPQQKTKNESTHQNRPS